MSFDQLTDWLVSCGLAGVLAIVAAVAVLFCKGALERRAKGTLVFCLLALLPLALGLIGTMLGNAAVNRIVSATPGSASPAEVAHGFEQALRPTQLGGAMTLMLLLFGVSGLLMRDDREG